VITIIVLLILAGISVALLSGENGILAQAQRAREETEIAEAREKIKLAATSALIDGMGKINYDNLDKEIKKEFKNNYTIAPEGEASSWKVTVQTKSGKEIFEYISETGVIDGSNITYGAIKGTDNNAELKYEVVEKQGYNLIRLYPKIEKSHTYGDYAANIIYGKSDTEIEAMIFEGWKHWNGEEASDVTNLKQMLDYCDCKNLEEFLGTTSIREGAISGGWIKPYEFSLKGQEEGRNYEIYANDIIQGKTNEELEEILVEGINYWNEYNNCDEPVYESFDDMITYWRNQGWTDATNFEDLGSSDGYNNTIECMIDWNVIKPEEFNFQYLIDKEESFVIGCEELNIDYEGWTGVPYFEYEIDESGIYEFTLSWGENEQISGEIEIQLAELSPESKIVDVIGIYQGKTYALNELGEVRELIIENISPLGSDYSDADMYTKAYLSDEIITKNGFVKGGNVCDNRVSWILDQEGKLYTIGDNHYNQLGIGENIEESQEFVCVTDVEESPLYKKKIVDVIDDSVYTFKVISEDGKVYEIGRYNSYYYSPELPRCLSDESDVIKNEKIIKCDFYTYKRWNNGSSTKEYFLDENGKIYIETDDYICINDLENSSLKNKKITKTYGSLLEDENGDIYLWSTETFDIQTNNSPICLSNIEGHPLYKRKIKSSTNQIGAWQTGRSYVLCDDNKLYEIYKEYGGDYSIWCLNDTNELPEFDEIYDGVKTIFISESEYWTIDSENFNYYNKEPSVLCRASTEEIYMSYNGRLAYMTKEGEIYVNTDDNGSRGYDTENMSKLNITETSKLYNKKILKTISYYELIYAGCVSHRCDGIFIITEKGECFYVYKKGNVPSNC
ncbi:MAG: hypothetical protein HUJ68_01590, partial [Clostridia bacterium]|nr:hypothetical protein [Clostridia bacterium]